MAEELNNSEEQAKDSDKNWKEMREKLESYEQFSCCDQCSFRKM